MNPNQIDEQEWANPGNWRWMFYYSKKDSRTFVPKRYGYGQTLNFAKGSTFLLLMVIGLMPIAMVGLLMLSRLSF